MEAQPSNVVCAPWHTIKRQSSHCFRVDLPPDHFLVIDPAGRDIVEDASTVEIVGCGRGVVCCAGLFVEYCAGVEEVNVDPLFGAEEAQD